jgi:hypothetical protein
MAARHGIFRGLEAAREKANALTSAARQGRDLVAEETTARAEYDQSFVVEQLIAEYAKRRLKGRLKTASETERRIRRALASVMAAAIRSVFIGVYLL